MKKSFITYSILVLASLFSQAYSKGIHYVEYHRDNIPNIITAAGIASEIILEDDEVIEYATFGFDSAWESQIVRDHILVFKAKDEEPETNLIIHTNKRDYLFTVTSGNNQWTKNPNTSGAYYSVRMIYKDGKSKEALAAKAKIDKESEEQGILRNKDISPISSYLHSNYDYRATGNAQDLIPYRIWDNGSITFIAFKPGAKRGVVYELDHNNKSSLINQHTEKNGLLVIHGIYSKMIIRLGDAAVELRRNTVDGTFENEDKTNIDGMMRMVSHDAPTAFKTVPSTPSLGFRRLQGEQTNNSSETNVITIPEDSSELSEED